MTNFDYLLKYFLDVCGNKQYEQYLRNIDKANGQQTVKWIDSVIQNKKTLSDALDEYDTFFANNQPNRWGQKTLRNYRTGYKKFAEVVIGLFSANTWLTRDNGKKTSLILCQLVADNAIFASKAVVDEVCNGTAGSKNNLNQGNPYASWDILQHVRRVGIPKGTVIPDTSNLGTMYGDMIADDNTIANQAMKKAVILSFNKALNKVSASNNKVSASNLPISPSYAKFFKDYEVCHIWGNPGDRRYYASIANLVLLPRAIAALSDHSDDVKDLLKYEAFKRFGFKPDGESKPGPPSFYNKIKWRKNF